MKILVLALAGCASSVMPASPDAHVGGGDAAPDTNIAATCGNGALDPGESCDGTPRACGELGGSFASGSAPCRADCRGWDPSACAVASPGQFEAVKPAQRDPRWA